MKIGFFGINFGVCGDPVAMIQVVKAAEQAGLESVWTGEHVVLPDTRVAASPSEPQTPFLDPVVALSHIAAHTVRLRLGTGVIILPQRNPVVLARNSPPSMSCQEVGFCSAWEPATLSQSSALSGLLSSNVAP